MILLALVVAAAQPAQGAPPVSADPPSPSASPAAAKAARTTDRDKLVCRESMATGHHINNRVCHTQYDWDRMEADGKAYAARLTSGQNGCPGLIGGTC